MLNDKPGISRIIKQEEPKPKAERPLMWLGSLKPSHKANQKYLINSCSSSGKFLFCS